jgi:hypothetical protein
MSAHRIELEGQMYSHWLARHGKRKEFQATGMRVLVQSKMSGNVNGEASFAHVVMAALGMRYDDLRRFALHCHRMAPFPVPNPAPALVILCLPSLSHRAIDMMGRLGVLSYAVSCMSSLMCMRLPGESTQWTCKTITVYASQSYRLAPWLASVYSLEIFRTHTAHSPRHVSLSCA